VENENCKLYCDRISTKYKELFKSFKIDYNDFIRTTEERHIIAVKSFWNQLYANGFIYKSKYQGWYSVNDESFLNDDEIDEIKNDNGKIIKISKQSGHSVEYISENNYMFNLKNFQDNLKNYLKNNIVAPKSYNDYLNNQIDELQDLSVSRETKRVSWGIQVPNDSTQVIYVWLDALVNYLTVAGYPDNKDKFKKLWPPDLHIIGKSKLQCLYFFHYFCLLT
jgi:methionyl-tRNA synthetase